MDGSSNPIATAEIYSPATGTWSLASTMPSGRYGHMAALLSNGDVLIAGGTGTAGNLATAEIYNPSQPILGRVREVLPRL